MVPSSKLHVYSGDIRAEYSKTPFKYILIKSSTGTCISQVQCYINDVNIAGVSQGASATFINGDDFSDTNDFPTSSVGGVYTEAKYGAGTGIDETTLHNLNSYFPHGLGVYKNYLVTLNEEQIVEDIQAILISPRNYGHTIWLNDLTSIHLLDSNYDEIIKYEHSGTDFPSTGQYAVYKGGLISTFTIPDLWDTDFPNNAFVDFSFPIMSDDGGNGIFEKSLSVGKNITVASDHSIIFPNQWRLKSTGDDFQFYTKNDFYVSSFNTTYQRSSWTLVGYVQDDTSSYTPMNFTGQHRTFIENTSHDDISSNKMSGLIVCANKNEYVKMSGGIAEGNCAIMQNEALPLVSLSTKIYDKSCFGVISESEDPEQRVDKYGVFCTPYQKEHGDTRVYINSVGEGALWVSDICGNLESGDYITTSNIPGYGMKQSDDILHNYTVAKITMDCNFDPIHKPIRKILKNASGENILNEHDQIQWEDTEEYEYAYNIRYLDLSGNMLTKEEYETKKENGENVHKAAFVGCTYHCG